jgi:IS1 family transposase
MLCEGMSLRAASRVADVSINTVYKLLDDAGFVCAEFHDRMVRGLQCQRIQADEAWAFCYNKKENAEAVIRQDLACGDIWTWSVFDPETKLVISYIVGDRSDAFAKPLAKDARARIATPRVQLTTDGLRTYRDAFEEAFGADIDYATRVVIYPKKAGETDEQALSARGRRGRRHHDPLKDYGTEIVPEDGTEPGKARVEKRIISGNPDPAYISTAFIERLNLTTRQHVRRFTRKTTGFSKRVRRHCCAVALHFCWYNFVHIHGSLRVTPAMAAGICDRLMSMDDIVALVEARDAPPKKRGPYKPRRPRGAISD